ncbi:MAG: hypothetical protein ACRCZ9_10060 [Fusobacteriaceae bacterium]
MLTKMLPSRLAWNDEIYYYPSKDFNRCYLGNVESYSESGNGGW